MLLVLTKDSAIVYHMSHFFTIGANTGTIPNALNWCVTVSATHRARGGNRGWLCLRGGINRGTGWWRRWVEQTVDINGIVMRTRFFMCSSIVWKKRVVAITSFLNDDGLSFSHLLRAGRVRRGSKNGGRRVNRGYLSLSKSKVQDDRGDDVLEWCRMTKNIENRLSFLLMMNKILSKLFKIMREK